MKELLKIFEVIEYSNESIVSRLAEPISLSLGYCLPQDFQSYGDAYDFQ
jgi:hypothetical protein